MADKRHWFRARHYGWGWTPVTWQGWLVTAAYFLALVVLAFFLLPHQPGGGPDSLRLALFILAGVSLTFILIGICYGRGELPRWQWGGKRVKGDDDATER